MSSPGTQVRYDQPQSPLWAQLAGGAVKGGAGQIAMEQSQQAAAEEAQRELNKQYIVAMAQQGRALESGQDVTGATNTSDIQFGQTPPDKNDELKRLRTIKLSGELGESQMSPELIMLKAKSELFKNATYNTLKLQGNQEAAEAFKKSFLDDYMASHLPQQAAQQQVVPPPTMEGPQGPTMGDKVKDFFSKIQQSADDYSPPNSQPQQGAIKSVTNPDGSKQEFHPPVEKAEEVQSQYSGKAKKPKSFTGPDELWESATDQQKQEFIEKYGN